MRALASSPPSRNVDAGVHHDPSARASSSQRLPKLASVFDAALDFRHDGGECAAGFSATAGNPNDLTLLFEWDDMERARSYMNSDELRKKMRQAGVMGAPEIQYLAEMYSVHRSAAD